MRTDFGAYDREQRTDKEWSDKPE